jgi:hypothetical protein
MNYIEFLDRDQLRNQEELAGTFLAKFKEQPIEFPPTYKMSVLKE